MQGYTNQIPFKKWIWHGQGNKLLLISAGIATSIQFIVLSYFYPYPNFLPDSYSYLEAAFTNQSINTWPIGYSKILRLLSCFTGSHRGLILFQYIFLQGSILYFLFTIAYLLSPGKWVVRVLFCCNLLNPLWFHVSNFVSSDALFAALSLLWFIQLLWIIYRPTIGLLVLHAFILLLAFTVRYNALYYPFISMIIIALSTTYIRIKLAGIIAIIILISSFVVHTLYKYRTTTGSIQFSAFGGWQLASNAMFAYARVPLDRPETVPDKFRLLHTTVNLHMDSLQHLQKRPDSVLGVYYLWDEMSPLKKYMNNIYRKDSITPGFKRWASMGPLYAQYGAYLIQQHPGAFVSHYLWPNLVSYYTPPAEFLGIYNMGKDTIEQIAVGWFKLKSNEVHASVGNSKEITVAVFSPMVLAVINLVFILGFISFSFLEGFKKCSLRFKQALWLMLLVWLCNAVFSVLASPIVLRYQVFPMVVTFSFLLLLMAFIIGESRSVKTKDIGYENQSPTAKISIQLS